jgi:hypothetical protein
MQHGHNSALHVGGQLLDFLNDLLRGEQNSTKQG